MWRHAVLLAHAVNPPSIVYALIYRSHAVLFDVTWPTGLFRTLIIQVMLYSMMSRDRRADPGSGLLLYLRSSNMVEIPCRHWPLPGKGVGLRWPLSNLVGRGGAFIWKLAMYQISYDMLAGYRIIWLFENNMPDIRPCQSRILYCLESWYPAK